MNGRRPQPVRTRDDDDPESPIMIRVTGGAAADMRRALADSPFPSIQTMVAYDLALGRHVRRNGRGGVMVRRRWWHDWSIVDTSSLEERFTR